jgi:hypothetical protein
MEDTIKKKPILLIDGSTLKEIFGPDEENSAENHLKNTFFEVATKCKSVIVCRSSPK